MTPDEIRFEWLRPGQIRARREKADVAFLPLGILEWHGVQSPLGTDAIIAQEVCLRACSKLGGGVVFPFVAFGAPRDSFNVGSIAELAGKVSAAYGTEPARVKGFCPHGGMDLQEQWQFYQRLLRMSLETIASFGFRSIYVFAGHGPLVHFARPAIIAFARASQMAGQTVTVDFGGQGDPWPEAPTDHGGKYETSLAMAAKESSVDLEELKRQPEYLGVGSGVNAVQSSAAQGNEWADRVAEAVAAEAKWLVENYPKQPQRHNHRR